MRTCVGCRGRDQRSVLVRVVLAVGSDTSRVVVDRRAVLPGRGAWLHADLHCLELADRRRAFSRALRGGPLDLTPVREHLEQLVVEQRVARPSFTEMGSGLEADGHPMSTQR